MQITLSRGRQAPIVRPNRKDPLPENSWKAEATFGLDVCLEALTVLRDSGESALLQSIRRRLRSLSPVCQAHEWQFMIAQILDFTVLLCTGRKELTFRKPRTAWGFKVTLRNSKDSHQKIHSVNCSENLRRKICGRSRCPEIEEALKKRFWKENLNFAVIPVDARKKPEQT